MNVVHRVRRWRWQARAPDTAAALTLRRALREQHEACEAALERACTAAVPAGEVWHVPRLELSVRLADLAEADTGRLAEQVEAALHATLVRLSAEHPPAQFAASAAEASPADAAPSAPESVPGRRPGETEARAALRHYLHTGLLPWTLAGLAPETARTALADAAVSAAGAQRRGELALAGLLPAGAERARIGALLRWLALLPPVVRRDWVLSHAGRVALPHDLVAAWRAWIDAEAKDRIAWQALWLAWPLAPATVREHVAAMHTAEGGVPPFAAGLLAAIDTAAAEGEAPAAAGDRIAAPPEDASARVGTIATASPLHAAEAAAGRLVPLAGLVLLHPWLPRLLGACGVLDASGKRIEPTQRPKAHALLHALACGDAGPAEHELPFVKLLLGGRPDAPLETLLPRPSAADRTEINALLAALREHWSALRGTAVEGLRLSFLQRRGLLSHDETGWLLRMQAESFDLLLATLPWPIGLVRLPWMPAPLTVEWHAP